MSLYLLPPDSHELLSVSGVDAARFLQGQLTCDVDALEPGKLQWAAICTNKGRVITPFLIFRQEDAYCLVFREGLSRLFAAALAKYLPFYKCRIDSGPACCALIDVTPDTPTTLAGQGLPAVGAVQFQAAGWTARLTSNPALLVTSQSRDALQQQTEYPDAGTQALRLWKLGLMQSGHFPFEPDDAERYTPQELHYDRRDYISFSKGCYTGQEIVARMHYRGKPKKQLYLATLWCAATPAAGELFLCDAEGTELGPLLHPLRASSETILALVSLPVELDSTRLEVNCQGCDRVEIRPF